MKNLSYRVNSDWATALKFELSWATAEDKLWLGREIKKLGRQRMNLHVMTEAKFILLKDAEEKIIGWGGLDLQYNKQYPEFFSLNLESDYRNYTLGLLIESVRATYALSQNVKFAFVRMSRESTQALLMKRLNSKFYEVID